MVNLNKELEIPGSDSFFQEVLNSVGIGIISLNSNQSIKLVNLETLNIFGYKQEEIENNNIKFLFHSTEHKKLKTYLSTANNLQNNTLHPRVELTGIHKDKSTFPVELTISNNTHNENCINTLILRDITKSKQVEEELKYQAYFDQLTEIPNRTLFIDRAETALNQAKRANEGLGIIFIDLDEFKEINDSLGHDGGDIMLKIISQRLINSARKSDTVSRRGGDEFTILMPRLNHIEDAAKLAERILESNKEPIKLKEELVYPKTSIGISVFPEDGDSIDILIQNADKAMYQAKVSGKNQYAIFQSKN